MKKKIISLLLAAVMLLGLAPMGAIPAKADDVTVNLVITDHDKQIPEEAITISTSDVYNTSNPNYLYADVTGGDENASYTYEWKLTTYDWDEATGKGAFDKTNTPVTITLGETTEPYCEITEDMFPWVAVLNDGTNISANSIVRVPEVICNVKSGDAVVY